MAQKVTKLKTGNKINIVKDVKIEYTPEKFNRYRTPLFTDVNSRGLGLLSVYEAKQNTFNSRFAKIYVYKEANANFLGHDYYIENRDMNFISSFYLYSYFIEFKENNEIVFLLYGDEDHDKVIDIVNNSYHRMENVLVLKVDSTDKMEYIQSILNKSNEGDILIYAAEKKFRVFPAGLPVIRD
ncbi:hypothetical protein [Algibacter pacificus]|uniref:hypothetical protein n=1 Tax=Algibacter pacificus TaxID=2599389 RepID=UPI0011C7ECCB|nr:hypothetical protein [Algibacter pacificus]